MCIFKLKSFYVVSPIKTLVKKKKDFLCIVIKAGNREAIRLKVKGQKETVPRGKNGVGSRFLLASFSTREYIHKITSYLCR